MNAVADYSKWISIQIRDSRKDTFVSLLFISALKSSVGFMFYLLCFSACLY